MKFLDNTIMYGVPFCYWSGSDTVSLIFFIAMFTIASVCDIMYYKVWRSRINGRG